MATKFVPADVAVGTARTLLYTCPASTQAVLFAGTVANIDATNMADHIVTVEVQKVNSSYVVVAYQVPVTFGGSLSLPKIALDAGEKIYLTADAVSVLATRASIVEKT
jgi:hypothetical protein